MANRRQFIKYGAMAGAGAWAQSRFGWLSKAYAAPLAFGLGDLGRGPAAPALAGAVALGADLVAAVLVGAVLGLLRLAGAG